MAIIPGVSRSGIVITASRFLNFDRIDSSKIAFYLSIPAISGASFLGLKDIFETGADRVRDDGIYDLYSQTEQGLAEDAKDKALNEQYMQEKQITKKNMMHSKTVKE